MKTFICLLALAIQPIFALAGAGEDFDRGYELATAKGCFECHTLGSRDAGPSFRAIAQRYRRDPGYRAKLPYIIRGGSVGHWGDRFAMWPQPNLSDKEMKLLVDWILSQ